MSKFLGGIAIGLVIAVSALLGVEETYPNEFLNSDTSAKLLGGLITAAGVIAFSFVLMQGGWVPSFKKEKKRSRVPLHVLRESGPMEGLKLADWDSVSLEVAIQHLRNGEVEQRVVFSDGERVLIIEADGSWKAGGIDRDSIETAVERDDLLP